MKFDNIAEDLNLVYSTPSYCKDNVGIFWCSGRLHVFVKGVLVAYTIPNSNNITYNKHAFDKFEIDQQDFFAFLDRKLPFKISSYRADTSEVFDISILLRFVIGFTTAIGGWSYDGCRLKFGDTVMAYYDHDQLTLYSPVATEQRDMIHKAFERVYMRNIPMSIYADFESDVDFTKSYGQTLYMLYNAVAYHKDCGSFTVKDNTILFKDSVLYDSKNRVLNEKLCTHEGWYVSDVLKIINLEDLND